ncbi:hypothetical protein BDZ90DRAFT_270577, partial [Jaminaea rosea]
PLHPLHPLHPHFSLYASSTASSGHQLGNLNAHTHTAMPVVYLWPGSGDPADLGAILRDCIECDSEDCLWDPNPDGNCGYHALGRALGLDASTIRLRYFEWLEEELPRLWPKIPQSIIDDAKRRVFWEGIQGALNESASGCIDPDLWLDTADLGFLAQLVGRVICVYDGQYSRMMQTYAPVKGPLKAGEPIALLHIPGHWQLVKHKKGAPLPPLNLVCWGSKKQGFLDDPFHQTLHEAFPLWWAFRVDPEEEKCGCRGAGPE